MPDEVIDGGPVAPAVPPAPESTESRTNTTTSELAMRYRAKAVPPQEAEPVAETPELPPEVDETDTGEPASEENTAETPEEVAPEQPAEETPAESEEVLLHDDDPKGVKKRIGKALEKQRAAEEKAAALAARIAELETAQPQQPQQPQEPAHVPLADENPDNRAASATTAQDLAKIRDEAERALEWAELNAEGVMDANGEVKFTAAEVRQIKVGAQRHLNRYIPRQEQFIARKAQAESVARQKFPEMFDTKSEAYHAAQATLRDRPHLRADPDAMLLVGYAIKGLMAEQAAAKAPAAATPAPAKPKPPPAPTRDVPSMTRPMAPSANKIVKDKLAKAQAAYAASGRSQDYQEVLRLRKQLGTPT